MKNFQTGYPMLMSRNKFLIIVLAFTAMNMIISITSTFFAHRGSMDAAIISSSLICLAQIIVFLFLLFTGFRDGIIATAIFYVFSAVASWVMFFVSLNILVNILDDLFRHVSIGDNTSWGGIIFFMMIFMTSHPVCLILPLWVTGLFDRKIKSAIGWSEPEKPGNPPREPNP